ncbi:kinase-like protein [Mycena rebaudengoi]|nr:kinase-like protein [Mycena rebaudengoi]
MPTASFDNPPPSPCSTDSSFEDEDDDDEVNSRVRPIWAQYRTALKLRGFRLDTVEDAKAFYNCSSTRQMPDSFWTEYSDHVDDALCPDAGLPDNLFRGTRVQDGIKVVIKAVHLRSREYDVVRFLSTPPLRDDPMNHCIPVLDLIELPEEKPTPLAFIVMEQWSSQLIDEDVPCCLGLFIKAIRQCIEHIVFMHRHRVAHLDISLRNLLTDFNHHYAYIDYEMSRRFNGPGSIRLSAFRATEVPPECALFDGDCPDPFKADVWALAVLILRACQLAGYCVAELVQLTSPMLNASFYDRPSMDEVLLAFDKMAPHIRNLDSLPSWY